ncbi:hypothetical protein KXR63_00730 [Stutzerimonas chloritidismutans]|uniref:hypothetical protein n=1 Tax=Stutzerimonas chloritidismutans TaxID=203192 RepID=UPI003F18D5AB
MNDTLKVASRIGAELGDAKAEVERLRGLLRCARTQLEDSGISNVLRGQIDAALSRQAGPAETTEAYTARDMATAAAQGFRDGQAAVEQAPAQDERGDFFQWWNSELRAELRRSCAESWAYCIWKASDANTRYNVAFHLSEIEQTEQQPEQSGLIKALEYYANGDHLLLADPDAWDTCSGEPQNFLHDDAGTASVEDGSIARVALEAYRAKEVKHEQGIG